MTCGSDPGSQALSHVQVPQVEPHRLEATWAERETPHPRTRTDAEATRSGPSRPAFLYLPSHCPLAPARLHLFTPFAFSCLLFTLTQRGQEEGNTPPGAF